MIKPNVFTASKSEGLPVSDQNTRGVASTGVAPARLQQLHNRIFELGKLIGAVCPSQFELCARLSDIVACNDPWKSLDQRRALTSVAARLAAVTETLLGMLAESDLTLADRDNLAAGLADRGVFLPAQKRRFRRPC